MSMLEFAKSMADHFQQVKVRHLSEDVIFITVTPVIYGAEDWEDVHYFGRIKTLRHDEAPSVRYYMSRLPTDSQHFNPLIRQHWSIENKLHWLKASIRPPTTKRYIHKNQTKMGGWSDQCLAEILNTIQN